MEASRVIGITASIGGPCLFTLENSPSSRWQAMSTSRLVEKVLLDAFFTGAMPEVELIERSAVIQRILPFAPGKQPYLPIPIPGRFQLARLATQRSTDGLNEHLEAFLIADNEPETAYNVFDCSLQNILLGLFGTITNEPRALPLQVTLSGTDIVALSIGEVGAA